MVFLRRQVRGDSYELCSSTHERAIDDLREKRIQEILIQVLMLFADYIVNNLTASYSVPIDPPATSLPTITVLFV